MSVCASSSATTVLLYRPNSVGWASHRGLRLGRGVQIYQLLTFNYVEDDDNMFRRAPHTFPFAGAPLQPLAILEWVRQSPNTLASCMLIPCVSQHEVHVLFFCPYANAPAAHTPGSAALGRVYILLW